MRRMDLYIADTDPVNGTDQVYTLAITATGGTFKFGYRFRKSSAVTVAGVTAASLQTALRTIPGWETSTVTGASSPFTITALGAVGRQLLTPNGLTIVENNATGGTVTLAVATPGVSATMRGQRVPAMVVGPTGTTWVSTGNPASPGWSKVGTQT